MNKRITFLLTALLIAESAVPLYAQSLNGQEHFQQLTQVMYKHQLMNLWEPLVV